MQEPIYYEVSFEIAREFIASWSDGEIASPAPISAAEITMMKAMLANAVITYNQLVNYKESYVIELSSYGVQYTPYYNKLGERIIWLNGFMLERYSSSYTEEDGDYTRGVVFGLDGGNYYFQTAINLAKQVISPVRINGFA
ncbi:MAG: hypothetical protein EOO56_28225 [Hymenobacter sp.]|nr:MAG: hypothetical protein EOO56_28225 [Hymenobacter sp.]